MLRVGRSAVYWVKEAFAQVDGRLPKSRQNKW
jgi:hypothetical protein